MYIQIRRFCTGYFQLWCHYTYRIKRKRNNQKHICTIISILFTIKLFYFPSMHFVCVCFFFPQVIGLVFVRWPSKRQISGLNKVSSAWEAQYYQYYSFWDRSIPNGANVNILRLQTTHMLYLAVSHVMWFCCAVTWCPCIVLPIGFILFYFYISCIYKSE